MVLVAGFSFIPDVDPMFQDNGEEPFVIDIDHIQHFVVFFVLGLLVVLDRIKGPIRKAKGSFMGLFAVIALYGFAIEGVQMYIPGRSFDMADMGFNLAGLGVSMLLYFFLTRLTRIIQK